MTFFYFFGKGTILKKKCMYRIFTYLPPNADKHELLKKQTKYFVHAKCS